MGDLKLGRQERPWFITTRNKRKRRTGVVVLLIRKGERAGCRLLCACQSFSQGNECTLCRGGSMEVSIR